MAINRELETNTSGSNIDKNVSSNPLLNVNMVECRKCLMVFRIERLTSKMVRGFYRNCPACGSTDIVTNFGGFTHDRWYHMASQFGLPIRERTVKLLKELMQLWSPSEDEYFKDYVDRVLADFKKKES